MTTLAELIAVIARTPGCRLLPPRGHPEVSPPHVLPPDMTEFYRLCGGMTLFEGASYPAFILEPEAVVPANPVIVGEVGEQDITASWYVIVSDGGGEYLTIDLDERRLGRCYDSFGDRHGVAGSCPIIATSFKNLLERLFWNKGQHWYWLADDFQPLGDAYDDV